MPSKNLSSSRASLKLPGQGQPLFVQRAERFNILRQSRTIARSFVCSSEATVSNATLLPRPEPAPTIRATPSNTSSRWVIRSRTFRSEAEAKCQRSSRCHGRRKYEQTSFAPHRSATTSVESTSVRRSAFRRSTVVSGIPPRHSASLPLVGTRRGVSAKGLARSEPPDEPTSFSRGGPQHGNREQAPAGKWVKARH